MFVVGTSYSVHVFRLVYGFDFGQWMNNAYVRLIMCIQVTIFIYSNYLKNSLERKDAYQIKNSIKASDFAVQITLPE